MNPSVRLDHRDLAVLEELEAGEEVTASDLRRLYRRHTDIKRKYVLRRRVIDLIKQPEFSESGRGRWEYLGLLDE